MKSARPISGELLARCKKAYDEDRQAHLMTAAAAQTPLAKIAMDPVKAAKVGDTFSIELKTRGITAQQQSGRCWLFASMNVMREVVAEKCEMDKFELSGNWLAFWDKFEKINFCLEAILDCADLPTADRTVNWVLSGMNDGGQWDMMVSIVKKYGIVPNSVMPETEQSKSTRGISQIINMKIHKDAAELRRLVAEGKDASARKDEMLVEYFKALCIAFGRPVDTFDFEYTDKNGKYHVDRDMTPKSFYDKYIGLDLDQYVNVINGPTQDKPYGKTYTVKYLGNVVEGHIKYLNLPMEQLKELVVKQMQAGELVWFGSDCGKFGDRDSRFWDDQSFDSLPATGLDVAMTKEEMLDCCDSAMNHAMCFTGVNIGEDGKPNRWKIENSWGSEGLNEGYYMASDSWFDLLVYQAVVHKKYLGDKAAILDTDPIVLDPWDPIGSLAD